MEIKDRLVAAVHGSALTRQGWCAFAETVFHKFLKDNSQISWFGKDVEKLSLEEKVMVFKYRGYEIKEIVQNINYTISSVEDMNVEDMCNIYFNFSSFLNQEKDLPPGSVRLLANFISADSPPFSLGFMVFENIAVPKVIKK